MFIIGIDPHKGSHTAAVLDDRETLSASSVSTRIVDNAIGCSSSLRRSRRGRGRSKPPAGSGRCWPSSSSPPARPSSTFRRRSRRGRGCSTRAHRQERPHDARSAAIVALRHASLQPVRPVDHTAVLRLLADRRHDLIAVADPDGLPPPRPGLPAHPRRDLPAGLRRPGRQSAAEHPPGRGRRASNASTWPSSSLPTSAASTSSSPLSAIASPTPSTRRGPPSPTSTGVGPIMAAIDPRPHRSHQPVPDRRALRPLQRHRPDRSVLGTEGPASAQPAREPPPQPRAPHRRGHADRTRHPRPGLLRHEARRGQDPQRSAAARSSAASATPSTASSSPTPDADQTGPGGQTGRLLASVTGSTP